VILQLRDYVAPFVHIYRSQADKLQEPEEAVFGEYAEEIVLARPCQVEVIEFDDPYRLIWLFLFDKTKPDLMVSVRKENWKNLGVLVAEFGVKYSELQMDLNCMRRTLEHFRNISTDNLNYSMDVFKNAYLICFPHDVRLGTWPLSRALNGDSSPQAVAEIIFCLNYSQSWDRYYQT
jgi:hypothetical protein